MKTIKMTLSALAVALLACSCGRDSDARDTPEKLIAEYRKCHEAGGKGIVALVYKSDQIPEKYREILRASIKEDADHEIREITVESYDNSNEAMMIEVLKKQGLKMPATPTNTLRIAFEDKGPVKNRVTEVPIALIDGSYYLLAPIKAE